MCLSWSFSEERLKGNHRPTHGRSLLVWSNIELKAFASLGSGYAKFQDSRLLGILEWVCKLLGLKLTAFQTFDIFYRSIHLLLRKKLRICLV